MAAKTYATQAQAIQVRTAACDMATQIMAAHGEWVADESAARLMALCIFFESYIASGSAKTQAMMKLMPDDDKKDFRVIAGGRL